MMLLTHWGGPETHYNDVIMGVIASQITSLTIVYSIVYSGADHRKHQSSASLAFVWGTHQGPVNSPHKWPVTRKIFPFHDVIIKLASLLQTAFSNSVSWREMLHCDSHFTDVYSFGFNGQQTTDTEPAVKQATSHCLKQWRLVHRRIDASMS